MFISYFYMLNLNIVTDLSNLLESEEFDGCQFEKLDVSDSLLSTKYFFSSTFIDCDLSNCDINRCTFRDCEFINCNLSLLRLCDTNLINIKFTNCKLIGIDWTSIVWTKKNTKKRDKFPLSFFNCTLNHSIFIGMDMYSVLFVDSMLKEVGFEDSRLECANFENTDLIGSHFKNTNLIDANLSTAINYTINGSANHVKGAKFSLPEAMSLIYGLEVNII